MAMGSPSPELASEEQEQRSGAERREVPETAAHVEKEEQRHAEVSDHNQGAVGPVVVEPGRREQQLVDRDRDEREVLIMWLEERVDIASAALEHPRPFVRPEDRPARLVEQEGSSERE
jgi:hypothetical protein